MDGRKETKKQKEEEEERQEGKNGGGVGREAVRKEMRVENDVRMTNDVRTTERAESGMKTIGREGGKEEWPKRK